MTEEVGCIFGRGASASIGEDHLVSTRMIRARIGLWLRRLADRIDDDNAPRHPGWSFTFEAGRGLVWNEDDRGCPVWYLGESDYERAHLEAANPMAGVNGRRADRG